MGTPCLASTASRSGGSAFRICRLRVPVYSRAAIWLQCLPSRELPRELVRAKGLDVTKKELAKVISEELGIPAVVAQQAVQRTFDGIVETLVEEGRIELRNFGVFEVKKRRPRMARNPRTGEAVKVRAKLVVTFKPGREM